LEQVFEWEVRQLAGGVLGQPARSALDHATEANVGMCFRSHEHMFARL
jgi:hypothetical protein